jgi:hypothetical protein
MGHNRPGRKYQLGKSLPARSFRSDSPLCTSGPHSYPAYSKIQYYHVIIGLASLHINLSDLIDS